MTPDLEKDLDHYTPMRVGKKAVGEVRCRSCDMLLGYRPLGRNVSLMMWCISCVEPGEWARWR
jgi:hypothetical protein